MNGRAYNFDIFAFAAPRSREDWLALATEALLEMKRVNAHLDTMFDELSCEANA